MTASLIVGCGYVGTALARRLVDDGEEVYAVTRSGVSIEGVESLRRDVTRPPLDLPEADRVYYLVSADSRDVPAYRDAYVRGLSHAIEAAVDDGTELVYASSTGVYETLDGSWVDEETPIAPTSGRSRVLLEAEAVARRAGGTAVRLAGLYGPGRVGVDRYLDGARVPSGHLNLVHRDDAARALEYAAGGPHDRYLAVDDEPVARHELARWLAGWTGREVGELVDEVGRSDKRCSNGRLRGEGWVPEYPTYREGYADALAREGRSDGGPSKP